MKYYMTPLRGLLITACISLLSACAPQGQGILGNPAITQSKISFTYGNPNSSPKCGCKDSRPVFATNIDTNATRVITFSKSYVDTTTNNTITMPPEATPVPANNSTEIGCTLGEISDTPSCQRVYIFAKKLETVSRRSEFGSEVSKLSTYYTHDSAAVCADLCKRGSSSCFRMRQAGAALFGPVAKILQKAGSNTELSKAEVLSTIKSDLVDYCDRGPLLIKSSRFGNSSNSNSDCGVSISRTDLPLLSQEFEIKYPARLEGAFGTSDVGRSFRASAASDTVRFDDMMAGVALVFPTDAPDYEYLYGGSIHEIRIEGDMGYAATMNGCISGAVK